jgi:hypothetical protein
MTYNGTIDELIPKMLKLDRDKKYELKEYKEKRTLKQNDYYHTLKNKLATKLRKSPDEVHFEMIRKSCPFDEYLVPYEASLRGIEYYEEKGKIERNGKLFKTIRVYVGSSRLTTNEMIVLLDNMIEECQLQGIETITPEELAKMRALERNMK